MKVEYTCVMALPLGAGHDLPILIGIGKESYP